MRANLLQSYELRNKKIKGLLDIKYPANKSIEDYLYNSVIVEKIEEKKANRFIGDGGSSLVHVEKVKISFVGSIDF